MDLKYFNKNNPFREMTMKERNSAKEKIYRSAKYLFLTNGYEQTTTREITTHADVSHGLITYYYKTKSAIFERHAREVFKKIDYALLKFGKCENDTCVIATFYTLIAKIMYRNEHFRNLMYDISKMNYFEDMVPENISEDLFVNAIFNQAFFLEKKGYQLEIAQKMAYLMLINAARSFTKKVHEGILPLTFEELPKYMLGMILPSIGISPQDTDKAILHGERNARRIIETSPEILTDEYFL